MRQTIAKAGQQIALGEGTLVEVLNPQSPFINTESVINDNGVALRLSTGKVSFLLTADISRAGELELMSQRADLDSTVLKVAHHGSETSTSAEFLSTVSPQMAVISVGKDNPHGHPNKAVVDRLEQRLGKDKIYRTDEDGTIEFITDGERLWVKTDGN